MKNEPIKKDTKKEFELKFLEEQLKHEQEIYKNHIDAFVKYQRDLAVETIRAEDMKDNAMKNLMEACQKKGKFFTEVAFGEIRKNWKDEPTEAEKIQGEINYYKNLCKWAETLEQGWTIPIKEKMATDLINNMIAWNTFFDDLSRFTREQNKITPERGSLHSSK